MPLDTRMVGETTEGLNHDVDARWIMSYAAGLNDLSPCYMDTAANEVLAHPLFPVCLEWPVLLSMRSLPGYEKTNVGEAARGVHAAHDLHVFRPIGAGDSLTTKATVIGLEAIKPGAAQTTRLDTFADTGELVCQTYQLGISRDVGIIGDSIAADAPSVPQVTERKKLASWPISVGGGAAHIYTECARIFNPIHTDRVVALRAGLPDIILHGTATLALAISKLVQERLNGKPERVVRLGGRFTAMVLMPSTIEVTLVDEQPDTLFFEVLTEDRQVAFSHGYLCFK